MPPLGDRNDLWVSRIVDAEHRGRPLALLFDFDGTLTPIVRHPSLTHFGPDRRQTLDRISKLPGVRVGVISGRAMSDVRKRVDLTGVYYAGSGGLEIDLLGIDVRDPQTDTFDRTLDRIHDTLVGAIRPYVGAWVERKPGAMAIHYREVRPELADGLSDLVSGALATCKGVRLREFAKTIEVAPADGWDKGTAVSSILTHMTRETGIQPFPAYFGDAENDREGMEATIRRGGLAVGIGPLAPDVAHVNLADPEDLVEGLNVLIDRLTSV